MSPGKLSEPPVPLGLRLPLRDDRVTNTEVQTTPGRPAHGVSPSLGVPSPHTRLPKAAPQAPPHSFTGPVGTGGPSPKERESSSFKLHTSLLHLAKNKQKVRRKNKFRQLLSPSKTYALAVKPDADPKPGCPEAQARIPVQTWHANPVSLWVCARAPSTLRTRGPGSQSTHSSQRFQLGREHPPGLRRDRMRSVLTRKGSWSP